MPGTPLCSRSGGCGTDEMQERLSRRTKLIYGSGDIGFSLTSTILGAYFAIFLTDVVGISLTSSRKSVDPWATSKRPAMRVSAPV